MYSSEGDDRHPKNGLASHNTGEETQRNISDRLGKKGHRIF